MLKKRLDLLVSSDTALGALNKSSDGSTFDIQLKYPLLIPEGSTNCTIKVEQAEIWWVVPNVVTGVNDIFPVEIASTDYDVTLPQGLYDTAGIANAVSTSLVNQGQAAGTFTFTEDTSTSKVIITFTIANTKVSFTDAQTCRVILGFNSADLANGATTPLNFTGDNTAAFNQVNYFLIHSDLSDTGIQVNGKTSQVIAQVLIDELPGSQIKYKPFNPSQSSANHLVGNTIRNIRMWLTDSLGVAVNTNGENWSARLVLEWDQPIKKEIE